MDAPFQQREVWSTRYTRAPPPPPPPPHKPPLPQRLLRPQSEPRPPPPLPPRPGAVVEPLPPLPPRPRPRYVREDTSSENLKRLQLSNIAASGRSVTPSSWETTTVERGPSLKPPPQRNQDQRSPRHSKRRILLSVISTIVQVIAESRLEANSAKSETQLRPQSQNVPNDHLAKQTEQVQWNVDPISTLPRRHDVQDDGSSDHSRLLQLSGDGRSTQSITAGPSGEKSMKSEVPPEFQPVTENAREVFSTLFGDMKTPDFGGRLAPFPYERDPDSATSDIPVEIDHAARQEWAMQAVQALRESREEDIRRMDEWLQDSRADGSRMQKDLLPGEMEAAQHRFETASNNIDQIADIVAYIAQNRGMGAKRLKEVIAPARDNIRQKIGVEGLAMLDMLFEEQAAREAEFYGEDEVDDLSQVPTPMRPEFQSRFDLPERNLSRPSEQYCQLDMSEIIEKMRDYGRMKQWIEFRVLYDSLTNDQVLDPELAVWTSYIIFGQGCVEESAQLLERCWLHHASSPMLLHLSTCLQIVRATTSFYSDCKLGDAVQQLLSVRNFTAEGEVYIAPSPLEALVESQSHRLMQEAFREGLADKSVFSPILLTRAKSMVALLREDGRIDDAVALACWAATWMEGRQEKEAYLHDFLSVIERPVSQAEIWLELALLTTDPTTVADYRKRARDIYASLDAKCQLLSVELEELEERSAQTAENVPTLARVSEDCYLLEWYIGQVRALQTACTISVVQHREYADPTSLAELLDNMKPVFQYTGIRYLEIKHNLKILTALLQTPKHLGNALYRLRDALEHEEYQMPATLTTIMTTIANGYAIIGDTDKALRYSKLAVEKSKVLSDLGLVFACITSRAGALMASGSKKDLVGAIELLESSFEKFAKSGYETRQRQMCTLLIQAEQRLADMPSDDDYSQSYHSSRATHWITTRDAIASNDPEPDILQLAENALSQRMFQEAQVLAESALEVFTTANKPLEMAECRCIVFHCQINIALQADDKNIARIALTTMTVYAQSCVVIADLARLKSPTTFLTPAALELYFLARKHVLWKTMLYTQALQCLALAAREGEKYRTGLVEDQGLDSLLQKRIFVSQNVMNLDYALGLRISLALDDAKQMWTCIQEYKAQSLTDVIGSQYAIEPTRSDASNRLVVEQLVSEEVHLAENDKASHALGSSKPQKKSDGDETTSNYNPLLHQARYVESSRVEIEAMDWLFASPLATQLAPSAKIVVVEWVVYDDRIVRTTLDASLVPEMKLIDVSAREVALFKSRHMSSTQVIDDWRTLAEFNKLEPLMVDLDNITNKDDLLIFSPSGLLNALPLHALRIGTEVAIDRNLIVYTSSLGVLKHCLGRSMLSTEDQYHVRVPRTAIFSHFPGAEVADERDKIQDCMHEISHLMSAEYYLEQTATSTQFIKAASRADILHYHGHVSSHPNILEHALELHGDQPTDTAPRLRDRSLKTGHFTTRDAFSLKLQNALVTVIGCGSGVQDVAAGDEPMGLMPALLCAGAATAVGTLWPIDSEDGRLFAREFYDNLANQIHDQQCKPNPSFVNLAVALRQAVRKIKGIRAKAQGAYHWAPSVLYGKWTM